MSKKPTYQRVLEELSQRIEDGYYLREGRNGRLPSQQELQAEFGIGNTTLRKVLDMLKYRGVITSQQGEKGYRVTIHCDSPSDGDPPNG